jgi:membrane-associated HD superfamily phosphohydrolase
MQYKINKMLNFCFDDIQKIDFQLFLITVKCLIPYDDKIGCLFDKDRYKKEIELFSSYMNGNDETIDYWLRNKEASNLDDNLLEYKIIPLALSNTVWENLTDELIKVVLFYTINKNTILNALLISSAVFDFMTGSDIDSIEAAARERLINFSVKEFLIKNQTNADKNYIIDFEKERIKMIAKPILFDNNFINGFKVLNYIFEKSPEHLTENNSDIIDSFSVYLYKLRKGLISPEKLIIPDKIPEIKECLKYSTFSHPLLGRCKVIKRTEKEAIVRNKLGLMRIKI